MKMLLAEICGPLFLLFLILFVGTIVGMIRIRGISLGLASILILSILTGYLLPSEITNGGFPDTMKLFSSFGTSLFLAVVGLSAGYEWAKGERKKRIASFLIGGGMVLLNFLSALLIGQLDSVINESCLFGTFCGAMTSTPGLAALCESNHILTASATVGYGGAYLFGVIGVVLFVQLMPRDTDSLPAAEKTCTQNDENTTLLTGMASLCAVIVCGRILGTVRLPVSSFSPGTSGGILCSGMLIGHLSKKCFGKRLLEKKSAEAFRNLGLAVFFVGTGVPAGMTLLSGFSARSLAYGILFTLFPILLGYLLARKIFPHSVDTALCIVCGIMTSTPAIGVLWGQKNRNVDTVSYSLSYTGALLAMVFSMRICAV